MSSQPVRRARLILKYDNKDIARYVMPHLLSFDYTDVVDGKHTDNMSVMFEDSDGFWRGSWFPERGATLEAALTTKYWPGSKTLKCGRFELDDISYNYPPSVCAIGALASGITSALRRQKQHKTWEGVNIERIGQEIAAKHSFQLEYDAQNYEIDQFFQYEQSDLELLTLLCEKYGLGMQIIDKKIRIFDAVQSESQPPEMTIERKPTSKRGALVRCGIRMGSSDVYTGVDIKYTDPTTKVPFIYRYDAEAGKWSFDKPPTGYILKVNERCRDQAEAERIGKAALRDANKREMTASITILGDPGIRAGMTVGLSGWGRFDGGQYYIDEARHHYDKQNGYETTMEIRGTLGY